jgi:hypothetical protein
LKEKAGLGRVLIGDHIPYSIRSGGVTFVTDLPPDSAYVARVRNAIGYNPVGLESISDLYTLGLATNMKLRAVRSYAAGDPKWKIKGFQQVQKDGLIWGDYQTGIQFIYSPMKVVTIPDKDQRLTFMAAKDYDPYRTVVISEPFPAVYRHDPPCLISATLDKEGPDFQSFQVTLKSPGWVVFSEANFPGWKALVDRTPSAVFTANHAFRALWMEAGEHDVEFRYEPAWAAPITVGLALWVLSLGLWGWPVFRRWVS